jgi:hypothetical protein
MSKSQKRVGTEARARKTPAKTGKAGNVLGTTADGVRILKPKGKATNFTARELQAAIASIRARSQ